MCRASMQHLTLLSDSFWCGEARLIEDDVDVRQRERRDDNICLKLDTGVVGFFS